MVTMGKEKASVVKKNGEFNIFKVSLEITEGKILALIQALRVYDSPVAQDLENLVARAAVEGGIQVEEPK